jgi:hypothetical protein
MVPALCPDARARPNAGHNQTPLQPVDDEDCMSAPVPYESATSGAKAREEITSLLRRMGCEEVGFMDDFAKHEVFLAFRHRGR